MRRLDQVVVCLVAVALVATMAIAGCAGPAPAGTPKAPAAQPITLTIWGGYPELEPFYKHVAQAYTAEHPNVKIEILTHPLREFEQKLSATIPSDTAADLIEISMYANQKFIEAGLIPELPANVKAYMEEKGRFSEFMHNNSTYKGKKYGLPLFMGRTVLYWNTEMFKEAGLSGPPET
ncbi:MAG TPA: extracellular solute-binding protein, partial [Anaerolineae bacterium]|nr:extracellular solute-binding protein [Anaerolineae bacterium]